MSYAVIKVTNGNFEVVSEWKDGNLKGARIAWRNACNALDNDKNFHGEGVIEVVDAGLNVVDGMRYYLNVPAEEAAAAPAA